MTLTNNFPSCLRSLLLSLVLAAAPVRAYAAEAVVPDWAIPMGHFYTQTNGSGGASDLGFAVVDDGAARFLTEFRQFGGLPALGYPVSQRFQHGGLTAQAFQKGILLWDDVAQSAHLMNLFDELARSGADSFLETHRFIPPSEPWHEDTGQPWHVVVANHLALLDDYPEIARAYFAERQQGRDPIVHNGLPMGLRDYGSVVVMRAQRRAFQLWKVETPWAGAGEVVVVNGGDLAKELNLVPTAAQEPTAAPVPPFEIGDAEQGNILFRDTGCMLCHGLKAGGGIGPALAEDTVEFGAFLAAVRRPDGTMPAYGADIITDQGIRDILAYVQSLGQDDEP